MILEPEPKPVGVRPEELRKGDLIRAVWKVNSSHNLQFIVRELDNDNVGGTFGDFDILLPITESWDFFMIRPAPRLSENYTFGWLTVEEPHDPGIASTVLGYWRTDPGNNDLVEGFVALPSGPEHRKYTSERVIEFTEAHATRQLQPSVTWTSTTNPHSTNCVCSNVLGGGCSCS